MYPLGTKHDSASYAELRSRFFVRKTTECAVFKLRVALSSPTMPSPDWISLYKAAVLESDGKQFAAKADAAITAIGMRSTELQDERNALMEALQNLQQLLAKRDIR